MTKRPIDLDGLRSSGLLWLINASVFHPRGFALAVEYTDGAPTGLSILGDGKTPWLFSEPEHTLVDESFTAVNKFFVSLKDRDGTVHPG